MAEGDLYRIRVEFAARGQRWENQLWYRIETQPPTLVTARQVIEAVYEKIQTPLEGAIDDDVAVVGYRCWPVAAQAVHPAYWPMTSSDGGLLGSRLPTSSAALFRFEQEEKSARHNGRWYFSGLNFTQQRDGCIPDDVRAPGGSLGNLAAHLAEPLTSIPSALLVPVTMTRGVEPWATPYGDPLLVVRVTIDPRLRAIKNRSSKMEGMAPIFEGGFWP